MDARLIKTAKGPGIEPSLNLWEAVWGLWTLTAMVGWIRSSLEAEEYRLN